MKVLKIIGGFFLGWLGVAIPLNILLTAYGLNEISYSNDLAKVVLAFCGGIAGAVIMFRRLNHNQ